MRLFAMRTGITLGLLTIIWANVPQFAVAQGRWVIQPTSSIAWWQVDPHLNHLWATTCPSDPSWRPGNERSGGQQVDYSLPLPKAGFSNAVDTIPMPAYPRLGQAEPTCPAAVSGEVTVADQAHWEGVRGVIHVLTDSLHTGNTVRDAVARRAVLESHRYPQVEFVLDSVTSIQLGDTLRGTYHGILTFHGVPLPFSGPVKGWMQGDKLRIQAQIKMLAKDLTKRFGVSKYALGLGVSAGIWRWLYCGVDLLLSQSE